MKAIREIVKGKEIDLNELAGRANQAQIQKVRHWTLKSITCLPLDVFIDELLVNLFLLSIGSTTKFPPQNWLLAQLQMLLHVELLLVMLCKSKNTFYVVDFYFLNFFPDQFRDLYTIDVHELELEWVLRVCFSRFSI